MQIYDYVSLSMINKIKKKVINKISKKLFPVEIS